MEWHDEAQRKIRSTAFDRALISLRALFQSPAIPATGLRRLCLTNSALALVYFLTGQLGLLFSVPGGHASPLWLPSGVALAAVTLVGSRVLPGIWLGAFAVNVLSNLLSSAPISLLPMTLAGSGIASSGCLAAVVGASLVKQVIGNRNPFERVRDVVYLLCVGGLVSCLVSAVGGTMVVSLFGAIPWSRFPETFVTWWIGDAVGVFVMTPFFLVWQATTHVNLRERWLECVVCFALAGFMSFLVFVKTPMLPFNLVLTPFMLQPIVLWAAVRTGSRGSVIVMVIISLIAVWGTVHVNGPFSWITGSDKLLMLDLFVSMNVFTALCMSATVTQQKNAEKRLWNVNDDLEQRVLDRTAQLNHAIEQLEAEITDRQQIQSQLAERGIHLRSILESVPECVKLLSEDGTLLDMNSAGLRMIEADSISQVVGKRVSFLISPEQRDAFQELNERVFAGGFGTLEYEIVGLKGTRRWLESHASPLRSPDGKITSVLSVTRDITDRHQAEIRLRASETRFSTIFRASPIGIVITTLEEGKYLDANDAFGRLVGHSREELIGRKSIEMNHWVNPQDRLKLIQELKQNHSIRNSEAEFRRKDGSIGYALRSLERLTLDGQDCVLTLFSDITETKRANAELLASRENLETLSHQLISAQEKERRHLARELHDELGQVLTAMKIQLWGTQQSADTTMRAKLDESLSMIDRAINQVRNLSLDLRPPQLDDLGLVPTLHWYLKKQSEIAGFRHHFTVDPEDISVSPNLATTCFRITQEAVTNAIRYAAPSDVFVELFQRELELHLTIRDNGRGFEVAEAVQRSARGDSLGLTGMQERANLAFGNLAVDSALGSGTTIHAWFPLNSRTSEGLHE